MIEAARKTVVITGATAGIGRATACEFARQGWNVAVLARGRDGLDATGKEIEEFGGKALAIHKRGLGLAALGAAALAGAGVMLAGRERKPTGPKRKAKAGS